MRDEATIREELRRLKGLEEPEVQGFVKGALSTIEWILRDTEWVSPYEGIGYLVKDAGR